MPLTLILGALLILSSASAWATPFVPTSDNEVVERLPFSPSDPALRELKDLSVTLKAEPRNLQIALRVARGYLELGRKNGDPRYVGYAQAALAPWWDLERPPLEVLLLRAAARQRSHIFDAALDDLAKVLAADPRNAQAILMRATVLQVIGSSDAARADCEALSERRYGLIRAVCSANVAGATGKLRESYEALKAALTMNASAPSTIRSWALTLLAEMAARADLNSEAETYFRAALAIEPDDAYLLAAYADLLLDARRGADAEKVLQGRERIDPLLLRLAIAARMQQGAGALTSRVAQLRERFEASRLRGEAVHQREEARFHLALLDDPKGALELARSNWRVQKEPADLRILAEAAVAASDDVEIETAREWLKKTRLEDSYVEKLLGLSAHPN